MLRSEQHKSPLLHHFVINPLIEKVEVEACLHHPREVAHLVPTLEIDLGGHIGMHPSLQHQNRETGH